MAQFVKPLIVPVVLAVLAFYTGQVSERTKQKEQDDRLAISHRRQLFVSTAQDFSIYITHWSRLMAVSKAEEQLQDIVQQEDSAISALRAARRLGVEESRRRTFGLERLKGELKSILERKERYIKSRDDAKDRLYGSFEQAHLFFDEKAAAAVAAFVEFDRQNAGKQAPDLPPADEWRKLAVAIFQHMRREIQRDEDRLKTP